MGCQQYIKITGDKSILDEIIGGKPVSERLADAMDYLLEFRFNDEYGLITGATTADWGDVQPEHGWGVDLDDNTHPAIDIYDNAMFIIALDNLMEMIPAYREKYGTVRSNLAENTRKHLWDPPARNSYRIFILTECPRFPPPDFDAISWRHSCGN